MNKPPMSPLQILMDRNLLAVMLWEASRNLTGDARSIDDLDDADREKLLGMVQQTISGPVSAMHNEFKAELNRLTSNVRTHISIHAMGAFLAKGIKTEKDGVITKESAHRVATNAMRMADAMLAAQALPFMMSEPDAPKNSRDWNAFIRQFEDQEERAAFREFCGAQLANVAPEDASTAQLAVLHEKFKAKLQ